MRNNNVGYSAEEYMAFHNLDLQHSTDLSGANVVESVIPASAVKMARETLGLSKETMAVLLGVTLCAWIRYENISVAPYPQGTVSRKMGILINWLADEKAKSDILNLLKRPTGLATLSGLLQSESVTTYIALSAESEELRKQAEEAASGAESQEPAVHDLAKSTVAGNA